MKTRTFRTHRANREDGMVKVHIDLESGMVARVVPTRDLVAVGSLMDLCPTTDYSEYMPRGTAAQRIGQHWQNTGRYLKEAIVRHERTGLQTTAGKH